LRDPERPALLVSADRLGVAIAFERIKLV
jgi:hypothetical protein